MAEDVVRTFRGEGADAAGDVGAPVGFARIETLDDDRSPVMKALGEYSDWVFLLPLGMAVVEMIASFAGQVPVQGFRVLWAVGIGVVTVAIVRSVIRNRRKRRINQRLREQEKAVSPDASRAAARGMLMRHDSSKRLWCVGEEERIDKVKELGPIRTEGVFEPLVFRQSSMYAGDGVVAFTLIVAVITSAMVYIGVRAVYPQGRIGLICCMIGGIVACVVTPFYMPRYVRISPGKMEFLSYRFLGRGEPRVRCIDLREARVIVNLYTGAVRVRQHDKGLTDEWRFDESEIVRVGHAVLMAAASTEVSPELPDDALA